MGRLQQWMARLSLAQKRQLKSRRKIKPRRMLLEILEEKKVNAVGIGVFYSDSSSGNVTTRTVLAGPYGYQAGDPTSADVSWQISGNLDAGDVIGPTTGSGTVDTTTSLPQAIGSYQFYHDNLNDENGSYTLEILDGPNYYPLPSCPAAQRELLLFLPAEPCRPRFQ